MPGRDDPSTGSGQAVARAIAFFEACEDVALLRRALSDIAPRARRMVVRYLGSGGDGDVPGPADVPHTPVAASRDDALKTLSTTNDFALLQAMTRAIGRRAEELQPPPR